MKIPVLWTPQAREDLIDIYLSISQDSPSIAERVMTQLEDRANSLSSYPRRGVRRPEILPVIRMLVAGSYLILYETHPDTNEGTLESVEIVRIMHGHRDLDAL